MRVWLSRSSVIVAEGRDLSSIAGASFTPQTLPLSLWGEEVEGSQCFLINAPRRCLKALGSEGQWGAESRGVRPSSPLWPEQLLSALYSLFIDKSSDAKINPENVSNH